MSRGITGPFETWKPGIDHPCMSGDIASTAGLTDHEPDDGVMHFAKWRPFVQNAVSRSAILAPAREEDGAVMGELQPEYAPDRKGCVMPPREGRCSPKRLTLDVDQQQKP